ncbi:MAG: hypothetical protein KF887_06020 [Paracoccaceae bacterium]|nr:MAG: hypothetical protein KF887_06020 [Paracoccaceae bacterium]
MTEETTMPVTYDISIFRNGETVEIGSITFDTAHFATLTLAGKDVEHLALRERWAPIAARDVLEVERSRRQQMADGTWIRTSGTERIARDSPDYPPAAMHFLASNYDYLFAKRLEPAAN